MVHALGNTSCIWINKYCCLLIVWDRVGYILTEGNCSAHSFDLGLGSRLFAWAQASICAQDYSLTIVIPDYEWAEYEFLHLPNTIVMNAEEISKIKWKPLHYYGNHLKHYPYWRIFGMCAINDQFAQKFKDPLWNIKFKSDKVNSFFTKFNNFVGFHLRRWHGVRVPKKDWNKKLRSLPNAKIRLEYYKLWNTPTMLREKISTDPPWITDKQYFSVLDKVDSNVYMSTDLPEELYQYYRNRYDNLYCISDYVNEFEELVNEEYSLDLNNTTNVVNAPLRTVVRDLFDLFALSNCYKFILSSDSQWGQSSVRLNNRPNHFRKCEVIGLR